MVIDKIVDSYAIAGAVAALNYLEVAYTRDLDILISFDNQTGPLVTLGPIVSYLATKGYTSWDLEGLAIEGWPVQFLPASSDLDREALAEAATVELDFGESVQTRVMSAEHIVATALMVGRPKDYLRINAFLDAEAVDLDLLKEVLHRHDLGSKWTAFCNKAGLSDPLVVGDHP
jgi:hypothetical protein